MKKAFSIVQSAAIMVILAVTVLSCGKDCTEFSGTVHSVDVRHLSVSGTYSIDTSFNNLHLSYWEVQIVDDSTAIQRMRDYNGDTVVSTLRLVQKYDHSLTEISTNTDIRNLQQ